MDEEVVMIGWRTWSLMAMVVAVCATGSAAAQPQDRQMGGIGITVFADIGYRGENATFRNDQPDSRTIDAAMGTMESFGNRAQSVQVVGTWQLCDGPNFSGRCVTVSQNVPNLSAYGLNNRVSSARPLGR
jgi:Beta/Gamma crystallin